MDNRARTLAALNYQPYDRLPVIHFGFWSETLEQWAAEGHVTAAEAAGWEDGNDVDQAIGERLGFDFNWYTTFGCELGPFPAFDRLVVGEFPDGSRHVRNEDGVTVLQRPGAKSIPAEIDHLLKDRVTWKEHYLPRLQFSERRLEAAVVRAGGAAIPFGDGGREALQRRSRETPLGLWCGSLVGVLRDWLGLEGLTYLRADDPALFDEMIETVGELCYQGVDAVLRTGIQFDFGHFWEDICFRSGPLIHPRLLETQAGPHYRRITKLLHEHNINIVSLDCDGKIDALIPTWLENGVNTMFPIEVGVWNGSLGPWRDRFGRALRGVGGMNKNAFARDYAAVDAEVDRLRALVELGGYIPCPDHRIPPNAKWENVQYYCERLRRVSG